MSITIRAATAGTLLGTALIISACDGEEKQAAITAEECPTSFWHLREEVGPFNCSLKPTCSQASGVFGSNPFMAAGGGICTAAIHAGLLKDEPIVVKIEFSGLTVEVIEGGEANGIETATPIPQPEKGTRLATLSVVN